MPFPIEEKLVIAVASSALFDLRESDAVFREKGERAYREYQRQKETDILQAGVAFPFIKRLLNLNKPTDKYEPVEVILLSRNDPDTGARVMHSIRHYGLPISRAAFLRGGDPIRYIKPFNASLFLSANAKDVREAIMRGLPAGRVLASTFADDPSDNELRIAFDFDGVIIDDEAERVYSIENLSGFHSSEVKKALEPHNPRAVETSIRRNWENPQARNRKIRRRPKLQADDSDRDYNLSKCPCGPTCCDDP